MKELQEAQKKHEILLMEERALRQASEEHTQAQLEHIAHIQEGFQMTLSNLEGNQVMMQQQLQSVIEQLQIYNRNKSVLGEGLTASAEKGSTSHNPLENVPRNESQNQSASGGCIPFPKVEFPHFDGDNPRAWIRKCNRYFQVISTIGEDQKVPLASVHLEGRAELWYQGYIEGREAPSWQEFVLAVFERFEDLDFEKVMGEFNRLQQENSVNNYLEKFEELKSYMLIFNKDLNEEFFTMKFINGLREDIKGAVTTMRPTNLNQAITLAKKQEATVDAIVKRATHLHKLYHPTKPPYRNLNTTSTGPPKPPNTRFSPKPRAEPTPQPRKLLTEAEMRARREKNLCYNCDEKYVPGHRCKVRQIYMIMSEEEEQAYIEDAGQIEQ